MSREPMTVDQLMESLEAVRATHGGDVPVVTPDMEPVVWAGVFEGSELSPGPWVIISDQHQEGGGEGEEVTAEEKGS
jgi:hypothetical protein